MLGMLIDGSNSTTSALLDRRAGLDPLSVLLSGRSELTRAAYRQDLVSMALWAGVQLPELVRDLLADSGRAHGLVMTWQGSMRDAGLSPATINRRLSAVRMLVRTARQLGLVTWSLDVPGERQARMRDTRGPGARGVRAMYGSIKGSGPKGLRDRAILSLLFSMALRKSEVLSLDIEHLDGDRLWIMGKGRREREGVTIPGPVAESLDAWVAVRGDWPGPLFVSMLHREVLANSDGISRERLSGRGLYDVVRTLGLRVGIKTRPHALRHASVTFALDATHGDIRSVAQFARHRDVRTTVLYDDSRQDKAGKVAEAVAAGLNL